MDDAFGDPHFVSDAHNALPAANITLSVESDDLSGTPVNDYFDTDLDRELQEEYGSSSGFHDTNNGDDEKQLSNSPPNETNEPEQSANSNSLLTPISYVFNFAATQFSAFKSAVSSRFDSNHSQAKENSPESDNSSSSEKIMTSLVDKKVPDAEKPFTTQDEILDEVNASPDENGICSPVVNLFFEKKLGLRDDSFMKGSAEHIYEEALKEKRHQVDLIRQGKDGLHAVFVDHNIPYETKQIKASDSESGEKVQELLNEYDQVLITYPTVRKDGERDKHQIYLEKNDRTRCTRFDVNKKGGVEEMPCSLFYDKLARKIAKAHDEKDVEEVIIAGIKK